MTADDLTRRMQVAWQVEIDPAVEERHLATVSEALRSPAPPSPVSMRRGLRTRLAAAAAAFMVFAAPAAAIAAEGALPSEALYPVKRLTERMRSLVDDDIIAIHRVEELETLLEREASADAVVSASSDAAEAVAELEESGELMLRLERAQLTLRVHYGSIGVGDQVPTGSGPGSATNTDGADAPPGGGSSGGESNGRGSGNGGRTGGRNP